ncbi:MAG: ABC transporter ATP-binding protein, partial [Candidatus Puniceispirillaceae bacterium]
ALDLKLRQHMRAELRSIQKRTGVTFIYITHDQGEALTMSDRIAVINDGQLQQLGSPNDIYQKPNNAFIADFIGESSLVPVAVKNKKAVLGKADVLVNHKVEKDGDFLLVIRPEKLFLTSKKEKNTNHFKGIVKDSIFQGESQLLVIELDQATYGGQTLQMRIQNGTDVKQAIPGIGEKISVGLRLTDSYFVENA